MFPSKEGHFAFSGIPLTSHTHRPLWHLPPGSGWSMSRAEGTECGIPDSHTACLLVFWWRHSPSAVAANSRRAHADVPGTRTDRFVCMLVLQPVTQPYDIGLLWSPLQTRKFESWGKEPVHSGLTSSKRPADGHVVGSLRSSHSEFLGVESKCHP